MYAWRPDREYALSIRKLVGKRLLAGVSLRPKMHHNCFRHLRQILLLVFNHPTYHYTYAWALLCIIWPVRFAERYTAEFI